MRGNINWLISVGILGMTLLVCVGEVGRVQLRPYTPIPFLVMVIGVCLKYRWRIFREFKPNPLKTPMIIGVILCIISTLHSQHKKESVLILGCLILGVMGWFLMSVIIREDQFVSLLLWGVVTCFFYVAGVGIYQYFFFLRVMRIYSTWGEPNVFGDYLLLVLPTFLSVGMEKNYKPYQRIVYLLAFTIGVLVLIWTYSRSAWVSIFVAIIGVMWYKNKKKIISIVCGIGVILCLSYPPVGERVKTIFQLEYHTNKERVLIWQSMVKMIKKYPITGIGLGTIEKIYPTYKAPTAVRETVKSAHNFYLRFCVEIGVGGIILLLLAIWKLFKEGGKFLVKTTNPKTKAIVQGGLSTLVGLLVLGMFEG